MTAADGRAIGVPSRTSAPPPPSRRRSAHRPAGGRRRRHRVPLLADAAFVSGQVIYVRGGPLTRAALVTGAASGIGRADRGAARRRRLAGARGRRLARPVGPRELRSPPTSTTREGNRAAVAPALERFGRLDALIPNAGFQHVSPLEEFDEDRWDALVALLLTSPFLLARYAWPALRASGNGRIVVVASVHGLVASPFKAGYVPPSTASSAS